MYSAGFYPYPSLEKYWAYWSRHIYYNRYLEAPKDTYKKLLNLLINKDYFVITTNVDHQFQIAGFITQSPDRKSSIARQPVSTAGIQSHSSTTAHASRRSRSEPRSRCRTFDQKHSDE